MIRHKIVLGTKDSRPQDEYEFFISLPARMQKDDLLSPVDLLNAIGNKNHWHNQFDHLIHALSHHVYYVSWEADEEGVYLKVVTIGE